MQIFKYELPIQGVLDVQMPTNARCLSVQVQHDRLMLWAEVDTAEPMVLRRLRVVGTGHEFDRAGLRYIGTVQMVSELFNVLVWHVYEDEATERTD
jgi:hypothetical protein